MAVLLILRKMMSADSSSQAPQARALAGGWRLAASGSGGRRQDLQAVRDVVDVFWVNLDIAFVGI
jgi:hypothetical protein